MLAALTASVLVSVISFIGVVYLFFDDKQLNKILILLVGFSAGSLIGGAFLHLIPESIGENGSSLKIFLYIIAGFSLFFFMEKFMFWRHCHKEKCEIHSFTYMNLIGDGLHNLIDGLIIGGAFYIDTATGMAVTAAIIFHEIPQEIGDFGVLVYGGMKKTRALLFNFLSASTAIAGTFAGYISASHVHGFNTILMPFAAGGFIYIAASDLVPELNRQPDKLKSVLSILFFLAGIGLMLIIKVING